MTIHIKLREHYGKSQLKKSTGERELRKAQRRQSTISEEWYEEFRSILGTDEYARLIDALALSDIPYHYRMLSNDPEPLPFASRPQNVTEANMAIRGIAQRIREYETAVENHDTLSSVSMGMIFGELRKGAHIDLSEILQLQKSVTLNLMRQFPSDIAPPTIEQQPIQLAANKSNYPRSSEFVEAYYKHRKWEKISLNETLIHLKLAADWSKYQDHLYRSKAQHALRINVSDHRQPFHGTTPVESCAGL